MFIASKVSVWGQVAKLYRDASLGNAINIVVSHIVVLSEDQVSRQQMAMKKINILIIAFVVLFARSINSRNKKLGY